MSNAFETLGLTDTATADEVKLRWRALASVNHPDRGGDSQEFDRLRKAYNQALAEASAPKPCSPCGGTGFVSIQQGWVSTKLNCSTCHGTGLIEEA
jgi:DnaJ-class molecular chaperone